MIAIDVLTIELTNKCDLDCKFCPDNKESNLDFTVFERIVKENDKLQNPIRRFELGGMGNPMLYGNIKNVLELLFQHSKPATIMTNGLNIKDMISYFDDSILRNIHFCFYLDSPNEEKNNWLMGAKAFNKTLEALDYLSDRNLKYDIVMRMNSQNFNEMEEMLGLCKHYGCNLFIVMETFPFGKDSELTLDDIMKVQVINTIDKMKSYGEPVHKTIHFETPEKNCSYLRKCRIFVNSNGMLSFCHFLSSLQNTEMENMRNKTLSEIIETNERIRNEFLRTKGVEINAWNLPRKTASPCSYCLRCYGGNQKW